MKKTGMSEINIPDWLMSLPAGEYCIPELCEKFGLSYHRIYQRLYALNIPSRKKEVSLGMGIVKNIIFFTWRGFEEESKKINSLRVENINKVKKGKK